MNDTEPKSRNQELLERAKANVTIAEMFVLKYDAKLPDGLGDLYVSGYGVHYDVTLTSRNEENRNRALAHMGDVFGRGGWEAEIDHCGRHFNWSKQVDGVTLKIGWCPNLKCSTSPTEIGSVEKIVLSGEGEQ